MFYLKEHLLGKQYSWADTANELKYTGGPSRRAFDRSNGNQVLLIINFLGKTMGKETVNDGRKLEELILTQLPEDAKNEMAVFNWLRHIYLY